jgi:hypothetical protein
MRPATPVSLEVSHMQITAPVMAEKVGPAICTNSLAWSLDCGCAAPVIRAPRLGRHGSQRRDGSPCGVVVLDLDLEALKNQGESVKSA